MDAAGLMQRKPCRPSQHNGRAGTRATGGAFSEGRGWPGRERRRIRRLSDGVDAQVDPASPSKAYSKLRRTECLAPQVHK